MKMPTMTFFLLMAMVSTVTWAASIIDNINTIAYPVRRIIEGDVVIFSSQIRPIPEIWTCPPAEPCRILCLASPPRPPIVPGQPPAPIESSCGNLIIVAGFIDELKIVCEDNACQGLQLQSSAHKNTIECLGHQSCVGSKIQCGAQTWNKYLHLSVPPMVQIEACIVTCSNGGCSAQPGPNGLPGAYVRCVGNVQECLIKANSAVSGFNYGPNHLTHQGSFNGGTMECMLRGPVSGGCMVECSDAPGVHYCGGMTFKCRTNPAKCRCNDFCAGTTLCVGINPQYKKDCSNPINLPHTLPTTLNPTSAPTTVAPTRSPSTGSPTASPTTGAPTASPTTGAPTRAPTTGAPTTGAPTTGAPTRSPTTVAPTKSPTTAAPTPIVPP